MRGKALGFVLALTMVLPGLAMPVAAEEQDLEQFYAERLAELQARWDQPSGLEPDEAAALLARAPDLTEDEAVALARFLAEASAEEDLAESPAGTALRLWYAGRFTEAAADTWQEGTWNDYGAALTTAYLALGAVNSDFLPHNLRFLGGYVGLDTRAGCSGDWRNGFCYLRITTDLLGLLALDVHQTTDTAVVQFPLSLEFHVHWRLVCRWFCYLQFTFHVHLPDTVVAQDAAYVFAVPAMAGTVATRVTDHEVLQRVYDSVGGINFLKPRQATSAALGTGTPIPALAAGTPLRGTPGVGDLHAVAPAPTYYGLQVPPEAPAKPGLPATPAVPAGPVADAVAKARADYGDLRLRVRDDFGTLPVDSTGPLVGFEMTQIRAWHLNLGIVRWKNAGPGTVGAPAPPASFYYDAGWSLTGGTPTTWSKDYSIRDPLL